MQTNPATVLGPLLLACAMCLPPGVMACASRQVDHPRPSRPPAPALTEAAASPIASTTPAEAAITGRLDWSHQQLTSLEGLAECPNLEWLDLSYNPNLLDLSGLRHCPNLKTLKLWSIAQPGYIDLAQLEVLEKIEDLQLVSLEYQDLSPLQRLSSLRKLEVRERHSTVEPYVAPDIAPIGQLSFLRELKLQMIWRPDLQKLRGLTELESLEIGYPFPMDSAAPCSFADLAGMTMLKRLSLYGSDDVKSLEPLLSMTQLEDLELHAIEVRDFSPIGKLPALRRLDLSTSVAGHDYSKKGLPVLSLAALAPCAQLWSLRIRGFTFSWSDLKYVPQLGNVDFAVDRWPKNDAIAWPPALEELSVDTRLGANSWKDNANFTTNCLHGLPQISALSLRGVTVDDLSFVSRMPDLERLNLEISESASPVAFSDLKHLKSLAIERRRGFPSNSASLPLDLASLRLLPHLESLHVEAAGMVSNSDALRHLTALKSLHVSCNSFMGEPVGTQVGLNLVRDMTALETLFLRVAIPEADLAPLSGLTQLKVLSLMDGCNGDLSPLRNLSALEHLHIGKSPGLDLSSLESLTRLRRVSLKEIQSKPDLQPLIDNPNFTSGSDCYLEGSGFSEIDPQILALRAKGVETFPGDWQQAMKEKMDKERQLPPKSSN